jgi:hypothetical protein
MISAILLIIAGIFNACMDVLRFKFNASIFSSWKNQQWINPAISSQNKWKYIDGVWSGEKFWGSSTVLVWTTDFWHFCKFLMLICIMFALVFYHPLINWWTDFLIFYCSFTILFEIFYSKIFILKKSNI